MEDLIEKTDKKIRRYKYWEIAKEFGRLLSVPVFIALAYFWLMSLVFSLSFLFEIVLVIVISGLVLFINSQEVGDYDDLPDIRRRLRNTIVVSLGAVKLAALINENNEHINRPSSVLLVLVSFALFFVVKLSLGKEKWPSIKEAFNYSIYPSIILLYKNATKLFAVSILVLSLVETYLNFGSGYILVPALILSIFVWVEQDYRRRRVITLFGRDIFPGLEHSYHHEKVFIFVFFVPFILIPISLGYQFWSREIISGLTWWQLSMIALAVFFVSFSLYRWRIKVKAGRLEEERVRKRQEKERLAEEEERRRLLAQQQANEEREKEIKSVLKKGIIDWSDVLKLIGLGLNPNAFPQATKDQIAGLSLMNAITVSHIKRRLVWNGEDLKLLLIFIADFFQHSFDDVYLLNVIRQVAGFRDEILSFKDYDGRKALHYLLKDNCRSILEFADLLETEGKEYS